MSTGHIYFNRLLLRTLLILGGLFLVAKAAIEDGGDAETWAFWIGVLGGLYFAQGLFFMRARVKKMKSSREDRER